MSVASGLALAGSQFFCNPLRVPLLQEKFDPALSGPAQVADIAGSIGGANRLEYADRADEFVRRRFFHSYSYYRPCDNWLAYVAGFLWDDLRSPVMADDILNYPRAACSQQAIVFQALLREMGIPYATVRLPGHFLSAAQINGQWLVYDANMEIPVRRYSLEKLLAGDPSVTSLYPELRVRNAALGRAIRVSHVNGDPAPRAALFHRVTNFLSVWLWAIFLAAFAISGLLQRIGGSSSRRTSRRLASWA